ncbi:hypothetical protein [Staphylococcus edaphicus]|uniref:Uncharacterized protein n=1 Tax=Staphylococcus edaphicus TaxID=1955013 RepID=A0A2C6WN10_9STAP|nr:hypothetical protein [Staphylococcus edaphicus]PHK49146.1 hypothetical protein BTJ66_09690 [Staphylococcus edaphicus]UQW80521.1 hypothetical protein MNY58_07865 [Staphylococcus edaphicus]
MGDLKGSFSIIFKELKVQLYTFSTVLVVLAAIYFVIGFYIEPSDSYNPLLSGPVYGILGFLPFFMFGDAFKSSIELGATRRQYILSLWLSYIIFIVIMLIIQEVISFILERVASARSSEVTLMRVADILPNASGFDNMWVDFLAIMFIAGICFLLSAIMYRAGVIPTLIGLLFVGVIIFIWFVLGDFTPFFKWVYHHIYEMFHILGAIGLISSLSIYPIMIKARLKV